MKFWRLHRPGYRVLKTVIATTLTLLVCSRFSKMSPVLALMGAYCAMGKSGQPVVRQTAAPHDFAHRIVIAGVINHSRSVCNRHAQHALGKLHRRFVSLNRVKIAL